MARSFLAAWVATCLALALLTLTPGCQRRAPSETGPLVRVGSKAFTESAILGEMLRMLAEDAGARAEHRQRLGDTSKAWTALLRDDLDAYCEYTGTLTKEVLAGENLHTADQLEKALAARGLRMSKSLGFSNNYALGMKESRAAELGVRTVSDLRQHPDLRLGFSHAFLERADGWKGLKQAYELPQDTPRGMEHTLAYQGLDGNKLDVIDLYTTDAQIRRYHIRVLEDDQHYFPPYDAVILYRANLEQRAPEVVRSLLRLEGKIDGDTMLTLNVRSDIEKVPESRVAADFLAANFGIAAQVHDETVLRRILTATAEHLLLVSVSLALAILTAIPLGVLAARWRLLGQVVLGLVGVVQTFPALALLTFLIIVLGIGTKPAIVALFLYSLLPIVRNTYTGLHDIPLSIRESAEALGLSWWPRLYLVELPMASRSILAGVKTAAVINVGFATLGGLIGAGGYGQIIMTGLDKNDHWLLLEGAVPAVLMALAVQGLFELAERFLVPRGLRLRPSE